MAVLKNCLRYYIDLLRIRYTKQQKDVQSGSAVHALQNIVRSMRLSRHDKICGEDFSNLDFGNIPLNNIEFSSPDSMPTVFDSSLISISNLLPLRDGHYRPITSAAISNDGEYLATGSQEPEGKVCVWNTWTKSLVKTILNPFSWQHDYHFPPISLLQFSPDTSLLCIGNEFGMVVYNLITNVIEIKIETAVLYQSEYIKLSSNYEHILDLKHAGEELSYYYIISDYDYNSSAYYEKLSFSIPSLNSRDVVIKPESLIFKPDSVIFTLKAYRKDYEQFKPPVSYIIHEEDLGIIKFILELSCKKHQCNYIPLRNEQVREKNNERIKPLQETSSNKNAFATQISDFQFEIFDKRTKLKNVLCIGQSKQVFVQKYNEGLISRIFNEPSILWNPKSLTIIWKTENSRPQALPHSPHRIPRLNISWDEYKYVKVNDYSIDLSLVLRKCLSHSEKVLLAEMFSSLKELSIESGYRLSIYLPYGIVECCDRLFYYQYDRYLIVIDLEANSLATIIELNYTYSITEAFLKHRNDPYFYQKCKIESVSISNNANYILIRKENTVSIYLREENSWKESFFFETKDIITSACFASQNHVAIATDTRSIFIFNFLSGEKIATLHHITDLYVAGCSFKNVKANDEVKSILYQNHALLE